MVHSLGGLKGSLAYSLEFQNFEWAIVLKIKLPRSLLPAITINATTKCQTISCKEFVFLFFAMK
jgi:hypothetical protein